MQMKKWNRKVVLAVALMTIGSLSGCANSRAEETETRQTKKEVEETQVSETQAGEVTEAETAKTENANDSDLANYSSTEEVTISLFTTQDHMKDSNYEKPMIIRYTWVADDPFQLEKNFYNMDSEPWVAKAKETEDLKVPANGNKAENIFYHSAEGISP